MKLELQQWMRIVLVGVGAAIAVGGSILAYRYSTSPVTLTIAAGSQDANAVQAVSSFATQLTKSGSSVRFKIKSVGSATDAANELSAGTVDLAIVRADSGNLTDARTVVLVTYGVVMIVVPPGSPIDSIDGLKGKTVGVVGMGINNSVVEALKREYDMVTGKVVFKDLAIADIPKASAVQADQCGSHSYADDRQISFNGPHRYPRSWQKETGADRDRCRRRNCGDSESLREL